MLKFICRSRCASWSAAGAHSVLVWACVIAGTSQAAVVTLAPQYAGSFATGSGADASFVRIDSNWQGSSVLWNESTKTMGDPNGQPVGSFGWGTGIWGRADWERVQATAAGNGGAGSPGIAQRFDGIGATINYGNSRYNECYSNDWGSAALLPFSVPSANLGNCSDAEAGDPLQQNWTAYFQGFIRVSTPGLYNFSVLYDDGFFFRLIGENGQALEIEQDYLNPRDREGFLNDLQLSEGLYGFELGSWNRLGAGVVDLRWSHDGVEPPVWTLVPIENLLPVNAIPEPAGLPLLAVALAAASTARRRRRPTVRPK